MAQYKYKHSHNRNDYWKLYWHAGESRDRIHQGLNELNFALKASTGGRRLTYLVSRAQRGLISFEKSTLKELRTYCTARHIQSADQTSRKKQHYVDLLEHDDDDGASFSRFLDLPPELRVRIYGHYMSALDGLVRDHVQQCRAEEEIVFWKMLSPPPTTKVCSTLRREAMPMFFDIFRLEIRTSGKDPSLTHYSPFVNLANGPMHLIDHVKRIKVCCWSILEGQQHSRSKMAGYSVHIDLATANKSLRVAEPKTSIRTWIYDRPSLEKQLKPARKHFAKLLEAQQNDKEPMTTLTKANVEMLYDISAEVQEMERAVD